MQLTYAAAIRDIFTSGYFNLGSSELHDGEVEDEVSGNDHREQESAHLHVAGRIGLGLVQARRDSARLK